MGYDADKNVEDILDEAERMIFEIANKRSLEGFSPVRDVVIETLDMIRTL